MNYDAKKTNTSANWWQRFEKNVIMYKIIRLQGKLFMYVTHRIITDVI